MIIQVQWRRVRLGLVCGFESLVRFSGLQIWKKIFLWLTGFCLSVAMLVKVAPGLAYVFMCNNIVFMLWTQSSRVRGTRFVLTETAVNRRQWGYFSYIAARVGPYRQRVFTVTDYRLNTLPGRSVMHPTHTRSGAKCCNWQPIIGVFVCTGSARNIQSERRQHQRQRFWR